MRYLERLLSCLWAGAAGAGGGPSSSSITAQVRVPALRTLMHLVCQEHLLKRESAGDGGAGGDGGASAKNKARAKARHIGSCGKGAARAAGVGDDGEDGKARRRHRPSRIGEAAERRRRLRRLWEACVVAWPGRRTTWARLRKPSDSNSQATFTFFGCAPTIYWLELEYILPFH